MSWRAADTVVFLGPTLDPAIAAEHFPATYLPPIRRGDLDRARRHGAERVLIIDGVFHSYRSVSLTEIRSALADGMEIWGASSMGALRAVEAQALGMRGIGSIFERYQRGELMGDDEVALVFTEDWVPLSEPLVNLREALRQAEVLGWVTSAEEAEAVKVLKRSHYVDRSLKLALDRLPSRRAASIRRRLDQRRTAWDLKRIDALLALTELRHHAERQVGGTRRGIAAEGVRGVAGGARA